MWLAAIHDPANWAFGSTGTLPTGSIAVDPANLMAFCFGDGSSNSCPCGNNGLPERGCDNSAHTGGALLDTIGSPTPDTLVLVASGMTPRTTALFQQQTSQVSGTAAYGDGIRCTSGSRLKLAQKRTLNGSARFPDVGDPSISARSGS
jgi:hypothetical protein